MSNYYEILGVSEHASADEIKKKFRELSLIFHPDKTQSSLAEEMMKKINEAYSILSDIQKRAQYDQNHDIFEQKTTQNKQKQAPKSAKSVWISQLKEMGKGLQKLWLQYLEFQKTNHSNQKREEQSQQYKSDEYDEPRHRGHDYCNCHRCGCDKPHQKKKLLRKNNSFDNSWDESLQRDTKFVNDMFGFGAKSKKEEDEYD